MTWLDPKSYPEKVIKLHQTSMAGTEYASQVMATDQSAIIEYNQGLEKAYVDSKTNGRQIDGK